jgi:CubicO group peptidase (beta-lactamase class C family)
MTIRSLHLLFVGAVLSCTGLQYSAPAWSKTETVCGAPIAADDGWLTASTDQAGVDAALLCSLNEMLDESPPVNVHSIVVARSGRLVYEVYRTGYDQNWGTRLGTVSYTADMPHDVRSISKSIVSLLFGIALDRGLIASVDDPVHVYFPDYAVLRTPEKDRILVRHLLTMTAGLEWNEDRSYLDPKNSEIMMTGSPDPYRFILEQPVRAEAGKVWNYSGGSTQLLAGVLQRKTGKSLTEFANKALFEPLGITKFEWTKMPANGEAAAASGLRLRPRDMAKIGQLVLNKGSWNGRRIVSEQWINDSTQPLYATWTGMHYGYQWWSGKSQVDGKTYSWIAARGLGGQRIFIVPRYNLVVAITAGLYNDDRQDAVALRVLEKYVLVAVE